MKPRETVAPLVIVCAVLGLLGCTQSDGDSAPSLSPVETDAQASSATSENFLAIKTSVFEVTYRLDGAISSGSSVGIDVPAGTKLKPSAKSGDLVAKGQTLGWLVASRSEPAAASEGTVARSQRQLATGRLGRVVAPTAGVANLSATLAHVAQAGLDVVVPLKPLQELRYRGMNFAGSATVETVLGQRTAPCVAVWIEKVATDGRSSNDLGAASAVVHCRLAADLETASGLPAVLSLKSQRLPDVIAVPLIYIGLDRQGENYVVRAQENGKLAERPVVVGATDGVRRVVTSGLAVGDVVAPAAQP